jgi:RND family efflux transporter MFP subunit
MTDRKTANAARPRRSARVRGRGLGQAVLTLLVLAVGVIVALVFMKLKKPPRRVEQPVLAPLVEVQRLESNDIQMVVQGYGTVRPKVELDIIPEVAGKVVYVHAELKAGGVIRANEKILGIDPSDYELAVQQAQAAVAEAKVRLDTEIAEGDVARREWRQLNPETEPDSPLVFREPQISRARAGLESARAQLATAELRLQRTTIMLPFDVLIVSKQVDLGQFVTTGQPLAKAYGVDAFEIEVPLEDEELAWFDVFEASLTSTASPDQRSRAPAAVEMDFAGAEHAWNGYVVRTAGRVDQTSRMVPVIVEVPDPLDITQGKPPLLPGAFVKVSIAGKTLEAAVAIPRDAIRGGNRVWLVNDNQLHVEELNIVRADEEHAYVTSGVSDGALVVTSALDTPVDGMQVRTPEAGRAKRGEAR